jgi:ribosomal protein S18 acetylase RimI-like enzyme
MNFSIRAGTPADAAALAELASRTYHETFAEHTSAEDMALFLAESYGPTQQGRELADPDISTLLVEAADGLAGFAQLRRGPAEACVAGEAPIELWRFYIAHGWHGRGVAQQLMLYVQVEAVRLGARTLWLGVWEHNERAKAFYGKCGFRAVGSHVFMVGTDPQTDRIMVRSVAHAAADANERR